MIKKEEIIPYVMALFLLIFVIYAVVNEELKERSLSDNLVYSKAVIIKFSSGPKGRCYVDYSFYADEKQYFGSGRHYPKSDTFSIGDSIRIVYDSTNPEYSKPSRDHRAGHPIDKLLEIRQE